MPAALLTAMATTAFALPQATEVYQKMGFGTNIGNTMEAPSDPTSWGNTIPTAEYIKAIKNAGFSTVRIPTAWDSHATDGTINADWLATVKKVVDLCINEGLYVILNSHWDNGWLEDEVFDGEHPDRNNVLTTTVKETIAAKQKNYWTQIANYFKNYDEHLIFASANEPGVNDPRNYGTAYDSLSAEWKAKYTDNGQYAFDATRAAILKEYHEACLSAVRATGGNNETRTIVVQMPRTEIDSYELLADYYPTDPANDGYTMAEAHYYPYQLTLMEEDASWGKAFYYWEDLTPGDDAAHTATGDASVLGTKAHIEKQFGLLKSAFVDKGIPVVIGEMGSIKRIEDLSGNSLKYHLLARAGWYGYVAQIAKADGIVPVIWDTGAEDNHNMTVIRRQKGTTGDIVDYEVLNALRSAYGLDTLAGNSIDSLVKASTDSTNRAAVVTYKSSRTDSSETGTLRINIGGKDWSEYSGIAVWAKVYGTTEAVTSAKDPWVSADLFVMSGSEWTWNDASLISSSEISTTDPGKLSKYVVNFDDLRTNGLSNPTNVQAVGINVYGTQFNGTAVIDCILLIKKDGTVDTLENFNKKTPSIEGTATDVELEPFTEELVDPDEPEDDPTNKAAVVTYESSSADSMQTGTVRINIGGKNWSNYYGIAIWAKFYGTSSALTGEQYGWASADFFVMSGSSWTWNDYNLTSAVPEKDPGKLSRYVVYFDSLKTNGKKTGLSNASSVQAIGINLYGTQFNGTAVIDAILLLKKDGSIDTVESFSKNKPEIEGTATSVELQLTSEVSTALQPAARIASTGLHFSAEPGLIHASFTAQKAGRASVALVNSKGQIVSLKVLNAVSGTNSVSLETNYRGAGFLILKQNSGRTAIPVRLK